MSGHLALIASDEWEIDDLEDGGGSTHVPCGEYVGFGEARRAEHVCEPTDSDPTTCEACGEPVPAEEREAHDFGHAIENTCLCSDPMCPDSQRADSLRYELKMRREP